MGNTNTMRSSIRHNLAGLTLALAAPAMALSAADAQAQEDPESLVLEVDGLELVVKADMTLPAEDITVYKMERNRSPIRLPVMQDVFDLQGRLTPAVAPVGAWTVTDAVGERVLLAMPDGSAEYTDTLYDNADQPVDRVDDDAMWLAADDLMTDLGAFEHELIDVYPMTIMDEACSGTAEECADPATAPLGRQHAMYGHTVDGWPTFGEGAMVSVRFTGTDEVVGMTHTLRGVRPTGRVRVIMPEEALRAWAKAIVAGEEWNESKGADETLPGMVEVTSMALGYMAPAFGVDVSMLEPCYEIQGVARSVDENGDMVETQVLWHEAVAREVAP
jgi:hypothetical protein